MMEGLAALRCHSGLGRWLRVFGSVGTRPQDLGGAGRRGVVEGVRQR